MTGRSAAKPSPLHYFPRRFTAPRASKMARRSGPSLIAAAFGSRSPSPVHLVGVSTREWYRVTNGENTMPSIGYVTRNEDGSFKGQLKTLSIRAEIEIVANTGRTTDTQPHYRVLSDGVEIGAGWHRRAESSGRDYVSLSLAAPEFGPRRLYANLGQASGGPENRFAVIWNPAD